MNLVITTKKPKTFRLILDGQADTMPFKLVDSRFVLNKPSIAPFSVQKYYCLRDYGAGYICTSTVP